MIVFTTRILGYGGASYNETGRIAFGGNNKG